MGLATPNAIKPYAPRMRQVGDVVEPIDLGYAAMEVLRATPTAR